MQKRIIANSPLLESSAAGWLDLEKLADVEISSEQPGYPIEAALLPELDQGWRADKPGEQTIRLIFKQPQRIQHIKLCFTEVTTSRTQEYVLLASQNNGASYIEIVRQQWNFNPEGGNQELEDHLMDLAEVTTIELRIIPDISGKPALATLDWLRVF
ncbi:MAG: carbohydrate-binding protein [Methylobacter sp.]|nr:MAG: carbohydrate-binding protein [Methylobacter sp.]PPD18367.1 MAG: carbohydrate-binding protein [Methylobacter sp.]PPD31981.1 MAG: carbohydrate-binding protein [Methylomonas sp.]